MNQRLSSKLMDAVKALDANQLVSCIVVTGSGEQAFSAGDGIHEQREDNRLYLAKQLDVMSTPKADRGDL